MIFRGVILLNWRNGEGLSQSESARSEYNPGILARVRAREMDFVGEITSGYIRRHRLRKSVLLGGQARVMGG